MADGYGVFQQSYESKPMRYLLTKITVPRKSILKADGCFLTGSWALTPPTSSSQDLFDETAFEVPFRSHFARIQVMLNDQRWI